MWDSNDYIQIWLHPYRCASDTQIRTARQKYTVSQKVYKQEDPMRKFLFVVVFLHIWCGKPKRVARNFDMGCKQQPSFNI